MLDQILKLAAEGKMLTSKPYHERILEILKRRGYVEGKPPLPILDEIDSNYTPDLDQKTNVILDRDGNYRFKVAHPLPRQICQKSASLLFGQDHFKGLELYDSDGHLEQEATAVISTILRENRLAAAEFEEAAYQSAIAGYSLFSLRYDPESLSSSNSFPHKRTYPIIILDQQPEHLWDIGFGKNYREIEYLVLQWMIQDELPSSWLSSPREAVETRYYRLIITPKAIYRYSQVLNDTVARHQMVTFQYDGVEKHELGFIPVVIVKNLSKQGSPWGVSDLEGLLPMIDVVNHLLTNEAFSLEMAAEPMLVGKNINMGNSTDSNKPIIHKGPGRVSLINPQNPNLNDFSLDYIHWPGAPAEFIDIINLLLASVRASARISEVVSGNLKNIGTNLSSLSLKLLFQPTLELISSKRNHWDRAFDDLCKIIFSILAKKNFQNSAEKWLNFTNLTAKGVWGEILPKE